MSPRNLGWSLLWLAVILAATSCEGRALEKAASNRRSATAERAVAEIVWKNCQVLWATGDNLRLACDHRTHAASVKEFAEELRRLLEARATRTYSALARHRDFQSIEVEIIMTVRDLKTKKVEERSLRFYRITKPSRDGTTEGERPKVTLTNAGSDRLIFKPREPILDRIAEWLVGE